MPHPLPSVDYAQIGAKWSATTNTTRGPLTAIGDSMGEARIALEQLVVLARALDLSKKYAR
jgi:hypothetical protein